MSRGQLANIAAILAVIVASSLMLCAHSAERDRSPMERLLALFAAARPAKHAELNGNWALVNEVYTR